MDVGDGEGYRTGALSDQSLDLGNLRAMVWSTIVTYSHYQNNTQKDSQVAISVRHIYT